MKRAGNLISQITEYENLLLAFWKARKGKDGRPEVEEYRSNLNARLRELKVQILNAKTNVGNYHYFTIYDPKERMICAASFQERVLHHALMSVCHPVFEDFQLCHSYATRLNKGTYAALTEAKRNQNKYGWFLKLDVRKYFDSIDHGVLKSLLTRRFKDKIVLRIFDQIIDSYHTGDGIGLPIGNLTSQYFANYYLAFADRLVKHQLKMPGYIRYMDDMVLWHNDKKVLITAGKKLSEFLDKELKLELKPWCLNKTHHGLNIVGYKVYPEYIRLNNRSKKRFVQKMKSYWQNVETGIWTQQEYQEHVLPLLAFTKHASTHAWRSTVLQNIGESSGALSA